MSTIELYTCEFCGFLIAKSELKTFGTQRYVAYQNCFLSALSYSKTVENIIAGFTFTTDIEFVGGNIETHPY